MPEIHADLINRAYEAMNARDVDAAKAMAAPDIELRTRFTGVAGRAYRGFSGIEQWFADVHEAWEDVEQIPQRFIEVSPERTIAVVRFKARGKASGVEVDQEIAPIFTIRGGRVIGIETHPSVDAALAAAGRPEAAAESE